MKTPDEIKKGLECCIKFLACEYCPYFESCSEMEEDALAYIQQLEKELAQERAIKKSTLSMDADGVSWCIEKGWISVEERLPEEGKFVLLQYAKNAQNPTLHARNTMAVGRYEYGMFLVEGCSVKITHWMPLPEPPEV